MCSVARALRIREIRLVLLVSMIGRVEGTPRPRYSLCSTFVRSRNVATSFAIQRFQDPGTLELRVGLGRNIDYESVGVMPGSYPSS